MPLNAKTNIKKIGVLAFHGDVAEHALALQQAAARLRFNIEVLPVRTKASLLGLHALVIPGGESPTLQKLCERADMWEKMKGIKNIFGTCAGAIILAKHLEGKAEHQRTLERMDIRAVRNAYGRQSESFEADITTTLGSIHAVFIRAPRLLAPGKNVRVLAKYGKEIVACEEEVAGNYYLAISFHPELTSTKFHKHFLEHVCGPVK